MQLYTIVPSYPQSNPANNMLIKIDCFCQSK